MNFEEEARFRRKVYLEKKSAERDILEQKQLDTMGKHVVEIDVFKCREAYLQDFARMGIFQHETTSAPKECLSKDNYTIGGNDRPSERLQSRFTQLHPHYKITHYEDRGDEWRTIWRVQLDPSKFT